VKRARPPSPTSEPPASSFSPRIEASTVLRANYL
jgi:hypothetical protein